MATKNISITEEAYRRLAALRKGNESFSELIISVTKKGKLSDCYGLLTKEEGDVLEKNIMLNRERNNESYNKRIDKLTKELSK